MLGMSVVGEKIKGTNIPEKVNYYQRQNYLTCRGSDRRVLSVIIAISPALIMNKTLFIN